MKPKIGLITTMSLDTTWPDEVVKKVEADHKAAESALQSLGFEVITAREGLSRNKAEMERDGAKLVAAEVEAVVLYVGTWTYSNMAVLLADIVGIPILVWTNSGGGNIGIVGGAIARGALDEVGHPTGLVHGAFDDEETLEKIRVWCTGTAAAMRLRGTTLGVGGSRCMGMYTAHVDPSEIRKQFGVDIDGWDEIAVIEASKSIEDDKVDAFYSWMENTFGCIEAKEAAVKSQIRMYLALKDIITEKGYDSIAVKCLPHLPSIHTTFCLAHALLNDASDADGEKEPFVCGCEADVNGTLTMMVMTNVSGKPVMFADFLQYEEKDNMVTLCNCGSQPTDFAPTKKDVFWVHEGLQEFEWAIGGCCPQYVARDGLVTMARLGRIDGEYVMLIMTGDAVSFPREKLDEVNSQQPQAFVRLHCTKDAFIESLRCNHIHVIYGDYTKELLAACAALGIRPIEPGNK
jgi:L-fucose/D-arabinose isomerase